MAQETPKDKKENVKWSAGRIINAMFWLYIWFSGAITPISTTTKSEYFCTQSQMVVGLNPNIFYDFPRFLGNGVIPIICWLVIDWLIRRRSVTSKGINKSPLVRIIFSVSVFAIGLIAIKSCAQSQCDNAAIAQGTEETIASAQQIESTETTQKAKDEFGEIERFIKTFMNKAASQQHDYSLELDAIGWGSIFDFDRIKQDQNLIESKILIQKAKNIVKKYKDQSRALMSSAKNDINSLNISEDMKDEMLRGFEETQSDAQSQMDAFYDLESKIISEAESIMKLLSERKGLWEIKDGNIFFEKQSDSDIFNSHVAAIQEYAAKEQATHKKAAREATNRLNRFNDLKN